MRILRLLKRDLAKEAEEWVTANIVTREQAEQILLRYGVQLSDAQGRSAGYWVLTALATVFAGLSLIVFVSANWDEIPRMARMLSLVGLTAVVNFIGAYLYLNNRARAGTLTLFFGGISYGVSIMLIAQIYHLGTHYPDGIFYWTLGVLPLVVLTQSRLIALQVLTLATIWMGVESAEKLFPWWYPLFALVCGWLIFQKKSSTVLFLGVTWGLTAWFLLLVSWVLTPFGVFDATVGMLPLSAGISLGLLGFASVLNNQDTARKDYGAVLALWMTRGVLLFLVIFSFESAWDEFHRIHRQDWMLLATMPILAAFGFLVAHRTNKKDAISIAILGAVLTIAFSAAFLDHPLLAAITMNVLILTAGIWMIRRGVDEGITHYYYLGIIVLLVTAVCRYFDLIGDYVGASLLFLIAAVVLFSAARFWKKHIEKTKGDAK